MVVEAKGLIPKFFDSLHEGLSVLLRELRNAVVMKFNEDLPKFIEGGLGNISEQLVFHPFKI